LKFLLKCTVELRVHPGTLTHTAGFVYRDVFKLDGR